MKDLTILYITDSKLDPVLAQQCRDYLVKAANGTPIISVSQEPLDLGENICVGDLPRLALSIDKQLYAGLERVRTRFVAVAEHDCIYSPEHFEFRPPDEEFFYYNENCWLVQYRNERFPEYDGMYSYVAGRSVQSQLICGTDHFREIEEQKIGILQDPMWLDAYPRGRIGEPGTAGLVKTRRLLNKLRREKPHKERDIMSLWIHIRKYINRTNAKLWGSKVPNLDIRHPQNFTGQRRGRKRRWELEPWGRFYDVVGDPHGREPARSSLLREHYMGDDQWMT
jgi:hypothetical protein